MPLDRMIIPRTLNYHTTLSSNVELFGLIVTHPGLDFECDPAVASRVPLRCLASNALPDRGIAVLGLVLRQLGSATSKMYHKTAALS